MPEPNEEYHGHHTPDELADFIESLPGDIRAQLQGASMCIGTAFFDDIKELGKDDPPKLGMFSAGFMGGYAEASLVFMEALGDLTNVGRDN